LSYRRMPRTLMSDWTRIADHLCVAEISGVLDLLTASGKNLGVLPKALLELTVAVCLVLAGCQGDEPAEPAPSSVQAFPDPPHAAGPIEVVLHPALPLMDGDRRCRPGQSAQLLCSSDGSGGFRALGTSGPVVVDEVSTAPSDDHTSWETTVRFAAGSRAAVRRARDSAVGFGGVVVVTGAAGVVAIIEPSDLTAQRVALLGLEKAEAWSVVDAFAKAQTRSKQGM